ncbi:mitogen-activated protein kinase kinase kinase SSK22 NDAI_0I00340 [Naumovozyma dairenensis CBS 421]|uniref:Protein kinase domain-containing protein n=1 Tax=Naumovozyma dairenensis (strain ATCC 10597 / BCRC 20456 / CBS 421 / NBRC 0211 / NRRL Y-12639) TaxID=1071378 RepID=G0WFP2_NAUDC|nr:hypothetical protein NDAI_0I00340 [Naumovozyma dairenensis CBS 421]CCD26603.1 hypothetical protein NDAI_0I00340 [Naumovozyma dairenensis CBS 421]
MSDQERDYFNFHTQEGTEYQFAHTNDNTNANSRVTSPGTTAEHNLTLISNNNVAHPPNSPTSLTPTTPMSPFMQSQSDLLNLNQFSLPRSPGASIAMARRPSVKRSQSTHKHHSHHPPTNISNPNLVPAPNSTYGPVSNNSSTHSSRRASLISSSNQKGKQVKQSQSQSQQLHQQLQQLSPSKLAALNSPKSSSANNNATTTTNPLSTSMRRRGSITNSDSSTGTPTFVIPPDLASLNTHRTSSISGSQHLQSIKSKSPSIVSNSSEYSTTNLLMKNPSNISTAGMSINNASTSSTVNNDRAVSNNGSTSNDIGNNTSTTNNNINGKKNSLTNTGMISSNNTPVITTPKDTVSSTSSSRSVLLASNNNNMSTSKSFRKQYILNEKNYLEKMRNNIADDDYYTRRIAPSPLLDEGEDDEDTEFDMDLKDILIDRFDTTGFNNPLLFDNTSGNEEVKMNDNDINFGTNFFTTANQNNVNKSEKNLVSMSSKYLLQRLEWLQNANPDDPQLNEIFDKIRNVTRNLAPSTPVTTTNNSSEKTANISSVSSTTINGNNNLHPNDESNSSTAVTPVTATSMVDQVPSDQYSQSKSALEFSLAAISDVQKNYIAQLSQHPLVVERFKWQAMLSNVLKGDIVRNEKTKIAKEIKKPGLNSQFSDEIWLELKAWMNGKTVEDLSKSLKVLRDSTDTLFEEILSYKIPVEISNNHDLIEEKLISLKDQYYKALTYWPNLRKMYQDKPICKSTEFINRIEAINSWLNFKSNFEIKINDLKSWVGNDELNVLTPNESSSLDKMLEENNNITPNTRSFAEQVMKEKDIETIFQKKIFFPLAPWILKSKIFFLQYEQTLNSLSLNYPNEPLELLLMFPMKLVKEIILIRLSYAKKLQNPTMMMIDQMIYDFNSYIRLSVQLKHTVTVYCSDWSFRVAIDPEFDGTVLEAIKYLFKLFNLKLLDANKKSFKTFKEPEMVLKYWDDLKNVGHYIDNAGPLISNEFNKLTIRLLHRLHAYLLEQQNSPPQFSASKDAEKWLIGVFENLGSFKRKLNRFTNVLTKAFQNSVNYKIESDKELLKALTSTGHFLIYTGGNLEQNGIYLIGSPELLGCTDEEIMKILNNSDIGCDLIPKLQIRNSLSIYNAFQNGWDPNSMIVQDADSNGVSYYYVRNELDSNTKSKRFKGRSRSRPNMEANNINNNTMNKNNNSNGHSYANRFIDEYEDSEIEMLQLESKLHSLGYIVVLYPGKPMLWEGKMFNLAEDTVVKVQDLHLKITPNTMVLMNQGSSYALEYQCDRFQQIVGSSVSFIEKRCSFDFIENDLQKINKAYFRFTYSALNNYAKVISNFQKVCPSNELLNSIFLFARDSGKNFLRTNVANYEKKSVIILLMIRLSVGWLSFLIEECNPTDQRTFRWCVPAMEFAMQMTSGYNILGLNEMQFTALKKRISACMSLLISHFDVMGARSYEAEKTTQQTRLNNMDFENDVDDDAMLELNSQFRLRAIKELEKNIRTNPRQIGKVLDDTDTGNKYLLSLASSMSNLSMRWQKRNFIGGGTFGTVFSAVNLDNGEILAVKEIRIQDSTTMKKIFPLIKEEMTVLEMLNHPNIVQYYGVEVHRDKVNIFMEYCEGGSLASLLEHGRIEDEMVTQIYTLELLEGLAYLHQAGVVHRDIKPENILLDFNGIIKYVDFGAARKIAKNGTRIPNLNKKNGAEPEVEEDADGGKVHDMMGTPMYMAPESITGPGNTGKFGSDDIWSLGCVVLEMVTGRRPWANLDNEWAIMYHVAAGHTPQLPNADEVTPAGRAFLQRCLVQDPKSRATAVELLIDPWIVEIREIAFGSNNGGSKSDVDTPIAE